MTLENLARINHLNQEPHDINEFGGLVKAGIDRLKGTSIYS